METPVDELGPGSARASIVVHTCEFECSGGWPVIMPEPHESGIFALLSPPLSNQGSNPKGS